MKKLAVILLCVVNFVGEALLSCEAVDQKPFELLNEDNSIDVKIGDSVVCFSRPVKNEWGGKRFGALIKRGDVVMAGISTSREVIKMQVAEVKKMAAGKGRQSVRFLCLKITRDDDGVVKAELVAQDRVEDLGVVSKDELEGIHNAWAKISKL